MVETVALRKGIDTCAFVSLGVYTETYTSADSSGDPIADLYASMGMLENAPVGEIPPAGLDQYVLMFRRRRR